MCLYGGAGWGGKSYWLRSASFELNMVLRDLGFPDSWGVLFTDTYENLKDRHIGKYVDEFRGIGTVQETQVRGLHVKFHGEGMGGVYLRNMATDADSRQNKNTKRGAERRWALFDELTEFIYGQFTKGMYTVRPDVAGLPFVAVGAATNPDGIGHQWVKEVFVPQYRNPSHDFFRAFKADQLLYVQALKSDNPAYEEMRDIIDARMSMEEDEDIRRARDEGAWDLYASGRFPQFRLNIHPFEWAELFQLFGVPEDVLPRDFLMNSRAFGFETYTSLDYGTSPDSISAYIQHLVCPHDSLWSFRRLGMRGKVLEDQAELIHQAEEGLEIRRRIADPMLGGRVAEEGQRGLTRQAKFRKLGLSFHLGINDRVEGAATCEWLLSWKKDAEGRFVRRPRARFLREQADKVYGVPELIGEIPNLPRDPLNPEDVAKDGGIHHWYDAWRYMAHTRYRGHRPSTEPPQWGSHAFLAQLARAQRAQMGDKSEW
jgi:hypothetical protein